MRAAERGAVRRRYRRAGADDEIAAAGVVRVGPDGGVAADINAVIGRNKDFAIGGDVALDGDRPGQCGLLVDVLRERAAQEGAPVAVVCGKLEAEIAELPEQERAEFLEGLGLGESGLSRVIREGYDLLRLVTFFTAGPKEVHAWTTHTGTRAPQAAGEIHSDFEAGFIRAEVIPFADLDRLGTEAAVRGAGLLRIEGRDYVVSDGDILFIRFNV